MLKKRKRQGRYFRDEYVRSVVTFEESLLLGFAEDCEILSLLSGLIPLGTSRCTVVPLVYFIRYCECGQLLFH